MGFKMANKKDKKTKIVIKNFDPEKYVNTEPTIHEAKKSTIVVSFGRMNPITTGHEKLVNAVLREATKRRATAAVYFSHSQDKKKNPLSYDQKIELGQKAFGKIVKRSNARTIIEVAKELSGKYDNLVVVVGSDRVADFDKLLETYNGREYNFQTIEVVSAGERDPDADDVTGMSASKLRSLASEGNLEEFRKGLPKKLQSSAKDVYDIVRRAMGINEETEDLNEETLDERAPLSIAQRRKRGLVMKRYKSKIAAARRRARKRKATPEKLKKRAQRRALEVIRQRLMKGKKYSEMEPAEKIALDKRLSRVPQRIIDRIATRLLPQVRQAEMERLKAELSGPKNESLDINEAFDAFIEAKIVKPQDPDVDHLPGSQPKGYYAGVKKSVKDDRARHFAKYSKKSDDEQSSYKPAPGDAGAKTKPSVHTKKFKQMFGESLEEASYADMRVRKRPHMAFEKNGSVKFDRRFKMYRSKNEINEDYDDLTEDLANLMLDVDRFIMSEEFDTLMENNPEEALKKKAEKTGISYGILKKVFDRGVAAWRTGHRPGTTPTQWGLARVNSFATKGKGTWGKADSDLASKVRNEGAETAKAKLRISQERAADARKHDRMLDSAKARDAAAKKSLSRSISEGNPDPNKREYGTDSLVKILKGDTPGETKKLKEESPLTKDLPRGSRVSFTYKTMVGNNEEKEGTVVGAWQDDDGYNAKLRLRVRDDDGRLYNVKHADADRID